MKRRSSRRMRKRINGVAVASDCTGKVRFGTQAMAREIAKRGRERKGGDRHEYRCRWCRGWHVGTLRDRPKRPAAPDPDYLDA